MSALTGPQESSPQSGNCGEGPAGLSCALSTLRKRSDFLRASRALHAVKPGFILQMRARRADEADGVRVGFTCSKKVGNAVARNRAKRRLREIARLTLSFHARDGMDYVLVGRAGTTASLPFAQLQNDLRDAMRRLHGRVG